MSTRVLLTLSGPDRVGIVEEVTAALLGVGANVETSRMARLGGEFTILMLVAVDETKAEGIAAAMAGLVALGYHVDHHPVTTGYASAHQGWQPFTIDVRGADHEGIIHDIAAGLSSQGISIESMETGTTEAPISGAELFTMRALVVVPPALLDTDWIVALTDAGNHANVDVEVIAS
jgi:glycine cleavage system transcriptional repressor